jgi:hypothetical protein
VERKYISAGLHRAEDGDEIYVKVGKAREGALSRRPETGAMALALTDTKTTRLLGDSKLLLINLDNWVGEGKG